LTRGRDAPNLALISSWHREKLRLAGGYTLRPFWRVEIDCDAPFSKGATCFSSNSF
jgi:hypothetical protein